MSLPPPPDPFRPPQPGYGPGQPSPTQWQPPRPTPGAHPPPQGQPYGQGPWGPPHSAPPPGPPNRGSGLKWLLITVAVLLVVAISVGATLLFTRGDGDNPPTATATPPTTGAGGDIASANDTGPVAVITEDPTCEPKRPVFDTLAKQERNGWENRDPSIPATLWTPEQRAQYEAVAQAMRNAADQTVAFAKMTPHRVMRELYEQTIAYWRAYADSIPTYTPRDNDLALIANSASAAVIAICSAIDYRSASARGPLTAQVPPPSRTAPVGDPADPQRFITPPPNGVCAEWTAALDQFNRDTAAWRQIDPNIPAAQWSTEQRAVNDAVAEVMLRYANTTEEFGRRSNNPILEDFATFSAQYRRAYVEALPSYTSADNYLSEVAAQLVFTVNRACKAAGS
jgi:hypothetical protein